MNDVHFHIDERRSIFCCVALPPPASKARPCRTSHPSSHSQLTRNIVLSSSRPIDITEACHSNRKLGQSTRAPVRSARRIHTAVAARLTRTKAPHMSPPLKGMASRTTLELAHDQWSCRSRYDLNYYLTPSTFGARPLSWG